MNAGLDFALAQVRDRDLVIESLREQLDESVSLAAEYERIFREEIDAAEIKLAEEHEHSETLGNRIVGLVQLAQDRQIEINVWRGRLETVEAKLAGTRHVIERWERNFDVRTDENAKLREQLEAERRIATERLGYVHEQRARAEAAEAKLAEERKARHAAEKVNADEVIAKRTNLLARIESLEVSCRTLETAYANQGASMDRARELAEAALSIPQTRDGAQSTIRQIARLFSGDE